MTAQARPDTSNAPLVLLGVGGGIAAFKAAALTSQLVQHGYRVRVAMAHGAEMFVGSATFAGLTGLPVVVSSMQIDPDGSAPHVTLTKEAAVFVVAPATANILARLAAGVCDDPVSLAAVAATCPRIVCPAMNDAMWEDASVQRNLQVLRERGYEVLGPESGWLAEGYHATGRMVEPDTIFEAIRAIAPSPR